MSPEPYCCRRVINVQRVTRVTRIYLLLCLQQLWVVVVECRLHLGGKDVQVEVAEPWQLGIDAGVKAVPRWRGMVESRSAKQPASFEV